MLLESFFFNKGWAFLGDRLKGIILWCWLVLFDSHVFDVNFGRSKEQKTGAKHPLRTYIIYIYILNIYIYMYRKVTFARDFLKSTRKLNIQILLFFSYFSSWVKELKHSMVNWLTQHISRQEQENPSEQGRKSARLLNTSLCSLNRLLRKLQVLLVILGPGLNLEVRRSFFLGHSEKVRDGNSPAVDMFC